MSIDLSTTEYNKYSFVIKGDTRKYKEELKKMGGKFNPNLINGPGWIFPKTKESYVRLFIENTTNLLEKEDNNKILEMLYKIFEKLEDLDKKIDLLNIQKKNTEQKVILHPQQNIVESLESSVSSNYSE